MTIEQALEIKQNWTAEQARNDLERLLLTGERPANKVIALACKALEKQIIDEEDKEILKLQKRIIFWREDLNYQPEKIKSEAIKEFAKWLKEKLQWDVEFDNKLVFESDIDNLVKEMAKEMTEV